VLNQKYIKHLQRAPGNDNQRLGNHHIANLDPEAQKAREKKVHEKINAVCAGDNTTIVCLQEVSGTLLSMLRATLEQTCMILVTRMNNSSPGGGDESIFFDNCNVVIANREQFRLTDQFAVIPAEIEARTNTQYKSPSECFVFLHLKTGRLFNVLCVHLSWSASVNFVDMFLSVKTSNPTIIAGDFNKGVRYPLTPADGSMHMRTYSNPRFKFPNPELSLRIHQPSSHVNYYKNAGNDAYYMLDRFDHIIFMDPPGLLAANTQQ
jgi:hypothetical protein